MATKKITTKTKGSQTKKVAEEINTYDIDMEDPSTFSQKKLSKKAVIVFTIIALLLLAFYKKDWFIAATVNNQPITNLELQKRLNDQYKTQLLNQIVNEKIIEQEAAKKGVIISPNQINTKVAETENQYGGAESFNALLSQQGVSKQDFIKQIKLQLIVEKLYQSEVDPTADEIKQFMDTNSSDPEATDEAKFTQTAKESIKQQKLSNIFQTKFQELKQSAKVQIF